MNFIKCVKCGQEDPAFDYAHVCGPVEVKQTVINEQIRELVIKANPSSKEIYEANNWQYNCAAWDSNNLEKFAELLKQAIYDQVKQELIDDADIDATTDPLAREYLKGCNGGTVDALCHIQNFGVDIDE